MPRHYQDKNHPHLKHSTGFRFSQEYRWAEKTMGRQSSSRDPFSSLPQFPVAGRGQGGHTIAEAPAAYGKAPKDETERKCRKTKKE
jgi:hypothetical protein